MTCRSLPIVTSKVPSFFCCRSAACRLIARFWLVRGSAHRLIRSGDLPLAERLLRAAVHESGHAVAALHFELPLRDALIRENGSGSYRYHHGLGPELAEYRAIVSFFGPLTERDLFPFDSCEDHRDLNNIDEMVERFGLTWDEFELGHLKFEVQFLVHRLRPRIRRVAAALVEHRHLSAATIARYAFGRGGQQTKQRGTYVRF
jgi:hypothetical protein